MASLMEIMQLCRLCLVKDQVNIPIFEEQGDIRQIFLKISACLPVKVSREDNLPKKICDGCSYKLEILYQFWNTSANSEKQLLKWLSQIGVEKNSTEKVAVAPAQPHSSLNSDGVVLKQEIVDLADTHSVEELAPDDLDDSNDAQDYILQQQQLPYQPFQFQQDGFTDGEATASASTASATITSETVEAAPKRKRRAAAMKALPPHIDSEEEDEDDVDMVETKIAKTEEQSDDSGAEDPEPTAFVGLPSTSTDNEQPGPSGVGKGSTEAPFCGENSILRRLIIGPSMMVTVQPNPNFIIVENNDVDVPENREENMYGIEDYNNLLQVQKTRKKRVTYKKKSKKRNPPIKLKIKLEGIDKSNIIKDQTCRSDVLAYKRAVAAKEQKRKDWETKIIKEKQPKKKVTKPKTNEKVHCDICETTFKNNISFALHSIKHNNNERYSCHMCTYTSASKYHFEMHVRAHEGSTRYKCEICNKAFTVSTHALEHKYFHTGEKPFQCEICGKHFMFSWFLTSHRRTQHWEIMTGMPLVKYDCTICKKHYTSSTGLKRHKLSQHNEEGIDMSVLCDICGKRLASKEKLKFHRRIHTGYKPHACGVCSKSFSRKEQLKEHERVHTGEKPFICKYCGKGFTQRSPLKIHERTHTGERPYVCRLCNKGFISKGVMDTHMKNCDGVPFISS